jgi:hypothetical protein
MLEVACQQAATRNTCHGRLGQLEVGSDLEGGEQSEAKSCGL